MRRALLLLLMMAVPTAEAGAVVGGRDASRPYPHMAILRVDGAFTCGASLVAPDRIVTAAHCVTGGENGKTPHAPARVTFVLGARHSSGAGGETFKATAIDVHEAWAGKDGSSFDVALITLDRPSTREPIAVADPATQRATWAPGERATVIGWGNDVSVPLVIGFNTTDELQEVDVPIVEDSECEASTGELDERSQLCAGEDFGGKDACQGDSGGPLMVPDAGGRLLLVGLVSTGFGCGVPTQFGVYTRVADTTLFGWLAARLPRAAPSASVPAAAPAPAAAAPAPATPAARKGKAAKKKISCKTRKQKRTKACKRIAKRRAVAKRRAAAKRKAAAKRRATARRRAAAERG